MSSLSPISRTSIFEPKKIGAAVAAVVGVAALFGTRVFSDPSDPDQKLGKKVCIFTGFSAVVLMVGALGIREILKQLAQPRRVERPTNPQTAVTVDLRRVHARDRFGRTPLHLAAERCELANVQALLEAGARVDAVDHFGRTPLYYVAAACPHRDQLHLNVAEMLLQRGADVNAKTKRGETLLRTAFHNGRELIEFLLSKGAYIEAVDGDGNTVLAHAISRGYQEITRTLLLNHGANPNVTEKTTKSSVLKIAIQGRKLHAIRWLLKAGAHFRDISERDFRSLDCENCALELVKGGFNKLRGSELRRYWEHRRWSVNNLNNNLNSSRRQRGNNTTSMTTYRA